MTQTLHRRTVIDAGFDIVATGGTAATIQNAGLPCRTEQIQFIVSTTKGKRAIEESRSIHTIALCYKVAYFTTIAAARVSCNALANLNKLSIRYKVNEK